MLTVAFIIVSRDPLDFVNCINNIYIIRNFSPDNIFYFFLKYCFDGYIGMLSCHDCQEISRLLTYILNSRSMSLMLKIRMQ